MSTGSTGWMVTRPFVRDASRPKSVQESFECKGLAAERDGHGELSI